MQRLALTAAALTLALAGPLAAQGWIEIERRPATGAPSGPISRVASAATVTIDGRTARVVVEERFRNGAGMLAEGSYLYPMAGEAVFSDFSLWMGDQEQRGEMMDAAQARGIYEAIVRQKRDPALLTLEGHGLIRAQVFPIQPGETRKIALRYSQFLQRSGDAFRFRYPLGQRGTGTTTLRIVIPDAANFGEPYSPTHQLTSRRHEGRLELTLEAGGGDDLELFLPLREKLVGGSLATYAPGGEGRFFMLLLTPPAAEQNAAIPRDLSLVVDVSGSMAGDKIVQARAALLQALTSLGPNDRFRIVSFSSGVRSFRDGFTPATSENLRDARDFVSSLEASGGTNISGALETVLSQRSAEGRVAQIVFVTDGVPSIGEQEPDRIAEVAASRIGNARIFTFGVGNDVNTYLLDRLAREGHGAADYVAPGGNVETAVGELIGRIQRPALTNLRIRQAPVAFQQAEPASLPDLFYGDELVVFGRYQGEGSGAIVIEGERNGRREQFTVEATFPAHELRNDFIPRLWAARRVGTLTRQIRIEGATPPLLDEVKTLALQYGILTEYTAYLVQEPNVAAAPVPRPMEDALRGGADASRAQTGQRALARAAASATMAEAKNLASAEQAVSKAEGLTRDERRDTSALEVSRVGGRIFIRRAGVWTDVGHTDRARVVTVVPFSDAYFALVRVMPELAPFLQVGTEVVVAGKLASVKIGAGGVQTWAPGELARFVQQFRGA